MVQAKLRSPLAISLLLAAAAILAACGDGTASNPSGAKIVRFAAEPAELEEPGDVALRWETTGATSLELRRGQDEVAIDGRNVGEDSIVVGVTESTTFTLTARDAAGGTKTARATVTVAPPSGPYIASFDVPELVQADEAGDASVTVAWAGVRGATSLWLEATGREPVELDPAASEGSLEVVLREDTTFTLVASDETDEYALQGTVRLAHLPVIEHFAAERTRLGSGETARVEWTVSGAFSIELWLDEVQLGAGYLPQDGEEVPFLVSSTLELRALSELGAAATASIEVEIGAPLVTSFEAAPTALWLGQTAVFSWETEGGSALTISLDASGETLCEEEEHGRIDASSCSWVPGAPGVHAVTLSVSNVSGVITREAEVFAADGPLITDFAAAPAILTAGDELELRWTVHGDPAGNPASLVLRDDRGRTYAPEGAQGSLTTTLLEAGVYEFVLEARTGHPDSSPDLATAQVTVHPRPGITLTADPPIFDDSVAEEVVLTWTTRAAETVVLYRLVDGSPEQVFEAFGPEREAGSIRFSPREDRSYRLVATNAVGGASVLDLEIPVAPTEVLSLVATPDAVAQGQTLELSWVSRMADEVTLDLGTGKFLIEETDAPYVDLASFDGARRALTDACGPVDTHGCASIELPSGFLFPLGGDVFDRVWVFTSGYLGFSNGRRPEAIGENHSFPTVDPILATISLAPFWDSMAWDLQRYPAGNVFAALLEEGGLPVFVIQWRDLGHENLDWRTASFNFEVALRTDGSFDFRYGRNHAGGSSPAIPEDILAGSSATIGFQLPDQTDSGLLAFDGQLSLNGSRDHRTFSFRPLPALPVSGKLTFAPFTRQPTLPITLTATRDGVSHSKTVNVSVARKPVIVLTPETIAPVPLAEEFRLGWTTSNADSLVVLDDEGTIRCSASNQAMIDEGVCALREPSAGSYRYTLRATGAHGAVTERSVTVRVSGAFGLESFSAEADSVERGADVLLSWKVYGAASVALLADGAPLFADPSGAPQGSYLVEGLEEETEFKLLVSHADGATEEATVRVGVWDLTIGLQASATSVLPGDPVTIDVDAKALAGGAPVRIHGLLPLAEIPGPEHRYEDISGLLGALSLPISAIQTSSVAEVSFPPGFTFPFMGEEHTGLLAFVDGYVSFFSGADTINENHRLPTSIGQGANVHLAPFWDDLHPRQVGRMYSARTSDDTFVIQWSTMSLAAGSSDTMPQDLNFQLVLHRDGSFEYRYGTMAAHPTYRPATCFPSDCSNEVNGSAATIGYQAPLGAFGHSYHFGGTTPGATNEAVQGGLGGRTFRYQTVNGTGSITFHPQKTETFSFCAISSGAPVCKHLEIQADFGLTSATVSREQIAFGETVTFSWQSVGGKQLRILDGDDEVFSTSDRAQIGQGTTVLAPTRQTVYVVELLAGNRRATVQRVIDVDQFTVTAAATASTGPGTPVTLSWNLGIANQSLDVHVATPMEPISNQDYSTYDLTFHPDAIQLLGANTTILTARLDFDDFVFPYFGTEHSWIRVTANGYLSWETGNSIFAGNQPIPNTAGTNHAKAIAPFWEELHTRLNGKVLAKKLDANRYVIQWSQLSLRTGSTDTNFGDLNFLVVLHRDGSFEFRYGAMNAPPLPSPARQCFPESCELESNGSSATIGYQAPGGTAGYQIHYGGTGRAEGQLPVAGGLSYRAWKFTPQTSAGAGSAVLHPVDSGNYKVCAYEPVSREAICSQTLVVDVPWGIDLFQANPAAPLAGQPVTLSWSVLGLDSLRILANGSEIASHQAPNIPNLGTLPHTPSGTTTYRMEATSLGRVIAAEQVVTSRAFDLSVSAPASTIFRGDSVVVDWSFTQHLPGDIGLVTPMSEIPSGAGAEGAFVDVSELPGAVEVVLSGENGFEKIALPFQFPYLGTRQDEVEVFADGYLSFSGLGGGSYGINTVFPASAGTAAAVHLAPFWDDLILRAGDSIWRYAPDATTLIIQWKQLSPTAGSSASDRYDLNFQVVLRADGSFDYRYGRMEPPPPPFASSACFPSSCLNEANGSSATIGYQSVDGRVGSNLHRGVAGLGFPFPGGLSHRGFRYTPSLVGSSQVVVGSTADLEVCGLLGDFVECKSVRADVEANAGDLMITELMIDPIAGVAGQWLEVRNLTHRTIDMRGFELRSQQGSHTIADSVPVPPRGFVTLAASDQLAFTPTYVYGGGVPFNRLSETLELVAGDATISTVSWGIDWDIPRGSVLALDPSQHLTGVQENSEFTRWCDGGMGGSPGSLGAGCLSPWYDLDPLSDRTFIDIAHTGTRFFDVEGSGRLARLPSTGFNVKLFGEEYARVWVASSGWLSLADTLPTTIPGTGAPTPPRTSQAAASLRGPLIGAFWTRLSCGTGCKVFYERREVSGQDVLIIQYDDVHAGPDTVGSLSFQVQLWEDGDLAIAFGQVDNPHPLGSAAWAPYEGSDSWIGIESADPSVYLTAHSRRILGLDQRTFHFRAK